MNKDSKILTWRFDHKNRHSAQYTNGLSNYTGPTIAPGYIYSTDEPTIEPCVSGLHGSKHPFDALLFAPGPRLSRTLQWGEVKLHGTPVSKLASRYREVLWTKDISSELRLFACWCVRQAQPALTDRKFLNVVATAELFARGRASKKDLDVARISPDPMAWHTKDTSQNYLRSAALCTADPDASFAARFVHENLIYHGCFTHQRIQPTTIAQRKEFKRLCMSLIPSSMRKL